MNETILYNITINAGRNYFLEFLTDDFDFTGWTVEATMREYAEHPKGINFLCSVRGGKIILQLSASQTRFVGWHHGEYDVFLVTPDNNLRIKLARGRVTVRPETAR